MKYRGRILIIPLLAGCLTASTSNLVTNPGAEQGVKTPDGWTAHPLFGTEKVDAGTIAEWADEAHSGKKALKITVTRSIGRTLDWSSDFIPVTGGISRKVSGWMKTENVVPGPNDFSVPNFLLRSYNRQQNMNKQFWVGRAVPRETCWTKYEAIVGLPEDAAFVQLRAGMSNCLGTASFDDFEVTAYEKEDALAGLLRKADSEKVRDENLPAIVPLPWKEKYGRRIEYSSEKDINIVRDKYRDFYEGGIRDFYLYLDDGPRSLSYPEDIKKFGNIAEAHYYLIDTVYRHLKSLNPQNKLYACLIHYGDPREWVPYQVEYIKRFSSLPAEIELINTGTMTTEAARKHLEITGRKPFVWDNWVSTFEYEKPAPSIVPAVGTKYSQDLIQYTTGYSFPIIDKDMMWYYAANYIWNASRYEPDKATELIMAKMFGPEFPRVAGEFGKYRDFVVKNRDFPFKGRTAHKQKVFARELVASFRSYETNLKELLPKSLAKEVEAGVREKTEIIEKALIPRMEGKPLPVIVPFTGSPPVIDGKTDEDCWKTAVRIDGFIRPVSQWKDFQPAYPAAQTDVMLLRSADSLHVAFSCDEPVMEKVTTMVRLKDGPVYSDDCVEVFLNPGSDSTHCYHVAVNSLGVVYDACGQDISWDSGALAAVSREKDRWTVEMTIPVGHLGGLKEPSGSWTFNVCRGRYAAGPEFSSWAYILKRFHEPQRFWLVDFATTAVVAETEKKERRYR